MNKPLIIHYVMLLLLLLGAGLLILALPTTTTTHWVIIGGIGLTYLVWAIWHHHDAKTLTKESILEYVCIIAIIILVLLLI